MVDKIMNIRILFYSFLGLHLIIWTVIPFITNNNLRMVKISKTYIPKETEKYMCAKHLAFFKKKLLDWKTDLKRSSNEALFNSSLDDNSTSADIVDQASSYTEKNVEMRAINRQIKLISKIDSALKKIQDGTYGFCEDTGEPIGLKRLMARPVATLCIAAQEKHEKDEKVHADD